jgi:heme a synthase
MSGTKAGLFFPTWPDIGGAFIPEVLVDGSNWQAVRFIEYDTHPFMPALLQFLHRNTAYLLSVLVLFFVYRVQRQAISPLFRRANWIMVGVLITQVTLGIVTLINCKAKIPVDLGVAHQAVAVLLLGMVLFVNYQMSNKSYETTA